MPSISTGMILIAGVNADKFSTTMTIKKAHTVLGHMSEDTTRAAAKQLGITITRGSLDTCEACAIGKAKQKNVPKVSNQIPSTKPGELMYLDISTIKGEKDGPAVNAKRHWRMMVDDWSGCKFSKFFTTKNGMIEPTLSQWHKWAQKGIKVQKVRMDNAGENKKLQEMAEGKDWKMTMDFTYTARDTPQQNHLVELGFATCANQGRAMMAAANLPRKERCAIGYKAFETACLLDGLSVVERGGNKKTRYEHFFGQNPKFSKHLRTWGEAGTVKVKSKMAPKLNDRGVTCMFVGYSTDHDGDCYDMWDPQSGTIYITRDIIWLKRMYYVTKLTSSEGIFLPPESMIDQAEEVRESTTLPVIPEGDKEEEEIEFTPEEQDEQPDCAVVEGESEKATTTRSGRTVKRPALFEDYDLGTMAMGKKDYKIELTPAEERFYKNLKELNELALYAPDHQGNRIPEILPYSEESGLVGAALGGGFEHTSELRPMKFKEAMATPDKPHWEAAVEDEYEKMMQYKVWEEVDAEEVPEDAKILTSTWAMKKKSNGTFRARLNARGFEQVDGEHYREEDKSSLVVNDVTI